MAQISCGKELNTFTKLTDCPADEEYMVFTGAVGGDGAGGYALRSWATIKACFGGGGSTVAYDFLQLTAEEIGIGETSFIVDSAGEVVQDSVWITMDGSEWPRDLTDRKSYGVVYDSIDNTKFTINFLEGTVESQLYIIHYAYIPA